MESEKVLITKARDCQSSANIRPKDERLNRIVRKKRQRLRCFAAGSIHGQHFAAEFVDQSKGEDQLDLLHVCRGGRHNAAVTDHEVLP